MLNEIIAGCGVLLLGVFVGLKARWSSKEWFCFAATLIGGGTGLVFAVHAFYAIDWRAFTVSALQIAILPGLLALYFLPWIIAKIRRHKHRDAILILNLFLGWTALGWIVALIWCAMQQPEK